MSRPERLAIAVSGGIDSLCLSAAAARARPDRPPVLFHAVSPAVPMAATARVRAFAAEQGLTLRILDSGEFDDPRYRANPVNRCYFCKSNLYGALRRHGKGTEVAAGTNLDDLGDFRPGLRAAAEHGILHPFIEAEMTKADVRALARDLGLGALAELPAAPCLASRIETGLRVEPADLAMIDAVETALREELGPGLGTLALRCRRLHTGIAVEIDARLMATLPAARLEALGAIARAASQPHGGADLALTLRPYRRGSAFVHA
ncbi:adenine nucleotide alpha-hydrolase family protein [Paenirhodobacter populi]|uniref:adenine nucleotide alpha hydrolase n=1 Tax=Paenirhodobacter populi TaxID=2306993 RepID=UPI001F4D4E9C|nr:adenine nucleotide alpha hydrolase [Sinirhodobacter populi]